MAIGVVSPIYGKWMKRIYSWNKVDGCQGGVFNYQINNTGSELALEELFKLV